MKKCSNCKNIFKKLNIYWVLKEQLRGYGANSTEKVNVIISKPLCPECTKLKYCNYIPLCIVGETA